MLSEILNYLKKNSEATSSEIAVLLKFDRSLTENALEELVKKGRIERKIIKHLSCGSCSGGCCSAKCEDNEVFRYVDADTKNKIQSAS